MHIGLSAAKLHHPLFSSYIHLHIGSRNWNSGSSLPFLSFPTSQPSVLQPFLIPVPPVGSNLLPNVTLPLRYILGFVRTICVLVVLLVYLALVEGFCFIFVKSPHFSNICLLLCQQLPVPPLRRALSYLFTSVLARSVLLLLGFFWIPVEHVTRKKGCSPFHFHCLVQFNMSPFVGL